MRNISHPLAGGAVTREWMLFTSPVHGFNVIADQRIFGID